MTRHFIRIGAAVMITLLGLWVLWLLRSVIFYVLISLVLAGAFSPLLLNRGQLKLPARIASILLYLLVLGGLIFFIIEVGGATVRDTQELVDTFSEKDVWQQPDWLQGTAVQEFLNDRLPPPSILFATIAGERGQGLLTIVLGLSQGIFRPDQWYAGDLIPRFILEREQDPFPTALAFVSTPRRAQARPRYFPNGGARSRALHSDRACSELAGWRAVRVRILGAWIPIPGAAGGDLRAGNPYSSRRGDHRHSYHAFDWLV